MKLFISYGHDDNQSFVDRIKRDLEAGGHRCWIDRDDITKGQTDWRRSLMDALLGCDWTVGFLSRHAMRADGVTAQELAIANDIKAGCLTTVLLEPLDGWDVPVAVGHTQWVDMSEWRTRQQDPAWYGPRLQDLLDRLSPALAGQYHDEISTLRDWLNPTDQDADYNKHLEGFVGRTWLLQRVQAWRLGRTDTKLFWLAGAPGTGKTAFATWITRMHHANVVALNLCRWKMEARCDARAVIRTLAFFVARRVQDYRTCLLRERQRLIARQPRPDPGDTRSPDVVALDHMLAPTLFDQILAQPLAHCFDGGRKTDRLLLVIDGLDEAMAEQGGETTESLLHVLREHCNDLPRWVGVLVTSRPDKPLQTVFAGVPNLRIDSNTA